MVRIALSLVLFLAACQCNAQSIESYKRRVQNSFSEGKVVIIEHSPASNAVAAFDNSVKKSKIKGYRIRIFFSNNQTAREQAASIASRFGDMFAGIPYYTDYEAPYFKVTVGNCITLDEVIILKNRIQASFETVFICREDIQLSKLSD